MHDAGPARRNGYMDSYKDASLSRIHQKIFIHTWYHFAISIHSQFVFKMPSPTNGSLELLTYPPLHKDIQTELYSAGVPLNCRENLFLLEPC